MNCVCTLDGVQLQNYIPKTRHFAVQRGIQGGVYSTWNHTNMVKFTDAHIFEMKGDPAFQPGMPLVED